MGDQIFSRIFGLPSLIKEFAQDTLELHCPQEVVEHLIREDWPMRYPHYPYCQHSDKEEIQRCTTLREFLSRRVRTLLYRECPAMACDGMFPVQLIISAGLDILTHLDDSSLESLLHCSFSSLGWTASETPDTRYTRLMRLMDEARTDPAKQRREQGLTVFEYCNDDNMKLEKLLDIRPFEQEQCDPFRLCLAEFRCWINTQLGACKNALSSCGFLESPYFEKGRLYQERLTPQLLEYLMFRENLWVGIKHRPTPSDIIQRAVQLKAVELRAQGKFKAAQFMRELYRGILRKLGYIKLKDPCKPTLGEVTTVSLPKESTVQKKWLTNGALDDFLAARRSFQF